MSIDINNFSIALIEYVECSEGVNFNVDVTTSSGVITTSGTYFTYNGNIVDTQFNPISGGYNLSYFTVPSGNILLDLNVSNSVGGTDFETYKFYYGYHCEYNDVVNYGPDTFVPVSMKADNASVKSNTSYVSTYFHTRRLYTGDLGAFITADGSGSANLMAEVDVQSKSLLYGKTYSVTVEGVKDYNGNVMPSTTFIFTIENE